MPDFSEMFIKNKGKPITYKGNVLYMVDRFPIKNDSKIVICIESTNSKWLQGLSIDISGSCEVNGIKKEAGKGVNVLLWENSNLINPKHIEMRIFTKKDFISIKNVWDTGKGSVEAWYWGAAMILEEIENGRRYRCNDGHPDEDFDDIVFTVKRVVK